MIEKPLDSARAFVIQSDTGYNLLELFVINSDKKLANEVSDAYTELYSNMLQTLTTHYKEDA